MQQREVQCSQNGPYNWYLWNSGLSTETSENFHKYEFQWRKGLELAGVCESAAPRFLAGLLDFDWQGVRVTPNNKRGNSWTTQDTKLIDHFLESTEVKQYKNVNEVLLKSRIIGQICKNISMIFSFNFMYIWVTRKFLNGLPDFQWLRVRRAPEVSCLISSPAA